MKVLVTGASGFIGRPLCEHLRRSGVAVRAGLRRELPSALFPDLETVIVGDVAGRPSWGDAVRGVDAIVHLAGRAHVLKEQAADPAAEFRRVNVTATEALARAAASAGVRRLVFVSSVKVHGDSSGAGAFNEEAVLPTHDDPYGASKWDAERALRQVAAETELEVVVVRPPLVYGPRVRANFLRLMRAVDRGLPLPFGSVENRRSVVFVDNLVDALTTCLRHPAAVGEAFFVADREVVSTRDLVRRIARALGRRTRLVPLPPRLLQLGAAIFGRQAELVRLTGSLVLDTSKIAARLGWAPPVRLDDGLAETAAWYRASAG